MARIPRTPKLCHHKATHQAYCTLDRKENYLGVYGSTAAQEGYDGVISHCLASGRTTAPAEAAARPGSDFKIHELVL